MDIEKIHSFLSGDLKGEELKMFEEEIQNNQLLRLEIELQREMMTHLSQSDDLNHSISVIDEVHNKYSESTTDTIPLKNNRRWYIGALAIAASLALLIVSNIFKPELTSDQIYNSFYKTPTASFMTKGSEVDKQLQKAETAYNSQKYPEALNQFLNLLANSDKLEKDVMGEVKFHIALCHMSLGNFNKAISEFQNLQSEHPLFENDSKWYMALSYLKLADLERSKRLLNGLSGSSYKSKSEDLLVKIESFESENQ